MKITIDIDRMNELQLTPNLYCLLYYLYYNLSCKISPDSKKQLYKLGFIDEMGNISAKGKQLFTDPDSITKEKELEIKELLNKMVDMFPKGVMSGNKAVRSTVNLELITRMKKFKKEYSFTDEIILQATKRYVDECKKNGYSYMRQFKYFLNKQGQGSDLADMCQMIIDGDKQNKSLSNYNIKLD